MGKRGQVLALASVIGKERMTLTEISLILRLSGQPAVISLVGRKECQAKMEFKV
jgi:hypothetical protein